MRGLNLKKESLVFWGLSSLVVLVSAAYLYYGFPDYPHREDSIATIGVIDQIANGVVPWGDPTFGRSPLGHVLMAIPVWIAGPSDYTYRIANLVFFALTLLVTIKMGEHLGSRLAGFVAAAFVAFSPVEGLIISYVRFYAIFQFFFLLACYLIIKYFASEEKRYILASTAVIFLTYFIHKLSLHLFAFTLIFFLCTSKWNLLKCRWLLVCSSFLSMAAYLIYFRKDLTLAAEDFNGLMIGTVGSMFDSSQPLFFYHELNTYFPSFWALTFWGIVFAVIYKHRNLLGIGLSFLVLFATVVVLAPGDGSFYYGHIFPVGMLFVVITVVMTLRQMKESIVNRQWIQVIISSLCPILIFTIMFLLGYESINPEKAFGQHHKFVDQKTPHNSFKVSLGPDDVVVSSDPGLSQYYLQQPVYFIRQKMDNSNQFGPFPGKEGDASLIDSPMKMAKLIESTNGSVWVYINWKYQYTVGRGLQNLVNRHVRQVTYYDKKNFIIVVRLGD